MKGIFGSMFDLNHEGNISPLESAMEFTFLNELLRDDSDVQTELELSGLDPDEYDKEAIKATYEGLGKIGYVANSSYTVIGDSMSAGRLYDKIGKKAKAKVVLVTDHGTICSISKKSLLENQKKVKKAEVEIEE